MALAVGQEAPAFTLKDQHGNDFSLAEKTGDKNVVLVFYPFTFTGVCQGELCDIRDNPNHYVNDDTIVAAISCDSRHSQKQWAEQQGFTFPVLSDFWPHGEVARAYGVFNEALGCANRASFVIGRDGRIADAFESPDLGTARPSDRYDEAIAKL